MKILYALLWMLTATCTAFCQTLPVVSNHFLDEIDRLNNNAGIVNTFTNRVRISESRWKKKGMRPYKFINTAANNLLQEFFITEKSTWFHDKISDKGQQMLSQIREPYLLELLDRSVINYEFNEETSFSRADYVFFKNKFRKAIGEEQYIQSREIYPFYTYGTDRKKILKFVFIEHGNDLLAPGTPNLDRDYTGSLHVEFGTDYLNTRTKRPRKSYQTLGGGLEVYTGNIRNSSTLVDSADRPFGAFQYLSWAKYVLSKSNKWRYYTKIKAGKIGGNGGRNFQNLLHSNVSFSKLSLGWDNQIVNGGRLAFSVEHKIERQIQGPAEKWFFQPYAENMLGFFMTKQSLGLTISNASFASNSHHHVMQRTKKTARYWGEFLKLFMDGKITHVTHNSMLTGFGMFGNKEREQYEKDVIAMKLSKDIIPFSNYVLNDNQVRPWLFAFCAGTSYTTSYATFFYKYNLFSPETTLNTQYFQDGNSWNLADRWHKFAEVGISMNLK